MFRPQIQKTYVLVMIAIFNIFLVYIASNSFEYFEKDGLNEKIMATSIMKSSIDKISSLNNPAKEDLYNSKC